MHRRALSALLPALLVVTACGGGSRRAEQPDLVIITVDSLRGDRPGFAGGPVKTPAMDALASAGAIFTEAYTTAPQGLPATASLLTGLYPPSHGAREEWLTRLDGGVTPLAERLQKAGYATVAFAGSMALHSKHGLDRGFDAYRDAFEAVPRLATSEAIGIPGRKVTDDALEWLGGRDEGRPYFLWINYFDTHFFHSPESPFKEEYTEHPYDGEVAMVDEQVGRILAWLSDHGRDAVTIVVLVGNHGEGLGEDGEQFHGILLGESTMRVPLVIRPAGSPGSGHEVKVPVSLVDVAPTVLELMGIDVTGPFDGLSLAGAVGGGEAPAPDRAIYFETLLPRRLFGWAPLRGVRSGETKYVEAPGTEWKALYDLGSDPGGSEDLSAGRAAEAGRLAAETARIGGEIPTFPLPLPENLAGPILALGMPATPPASELQLPQDHVDVGNAAVQARRSLQRRMMRSALYLLNDVITADPENYLALMDIAQVSIGIGQLPVAEKNLATLQARYPADGEIYHQLGHLALTEGKPGALERARTFFTTAAALAPLNEEALYDSACAVSGEDPERALDYLERALHNGFRDFEHIKVDTDMDPLREMERFREITGLDGTAPPGASPVSPASGDPAAAGSR